MAWEIVIGIETHAQLLTRSKIFSRASTAFGAEPNTQASAVDLALPGTLPVLNRQAVELAIKFGLEVGGPGVISRRSIFARKNYFYPDLPKGYQISQFELPIVTGGAIKIETESGTKTIRLTRAHLEEDAGKSLHEDFHGMTGIDLNRAGTPLLEIVSEPELRGAKEAVAYAKALHTRVRWIDICDGNMQEGSFRCDANVSVRKVGDSKLGTRCEIKNLNSFLFMEQAIEFEARRQIEILESGGKVDQETRLFDVSLGETRAMRSKEDAQDYRYFPDPDLLPLVVTEADIDRIQQKLPERHESVWNRFTKEYGFSVEMSYSLTLRREVAEYFDALFKNLLRLAGGYPQADRVQAVNWARLEVAAAMGRTDLPVNQIDIERLTGLLIRILDGTISRTIAKEVLDVMWNGNSTADEVIEERGLRQISDAGALEKLVDEAIAGGAKQVADYRAGKEKALQSLVGQVMKASKGKANPAQVNEILRRKLGG